MFLRLRRARGVCDFIILVYVMKKAFKNFILFLNIICIALCFFNITAFAETQYTVSVSILSDNITLAQYTVLTPQIANLEALGGDRAAFTADDTGAVNSITVNGRTLKADGEHFITVHLNGREIQSCEVKVADGDAFVFKYITNESEPVSSKTESGREPVSSKRPHVSSAQTSSSQSEPAAQQSNTDISSDKAEDISSTKSEASSESVSSRESAETSSFVNPNRYKWDSELDDILDSACSWLSVNDDSMMQLIALSSAGKPARANAVDKFLQSVKVNGGAFTSDADIFYAVLSSTFSGIDAENVRDINLIEIMLKKSMNI